MQCQADPLHLSVATQKMLALWATVLSILARIYAHRDQTATFNEKINKLVKVMLKTCKIRNV